MLNPSKSKNNPLKKSITPEPEISCQTINLSDIPDFLHPENSNSELYIYLTQKVNWPYYSLQDIYEKQNNESVSAKKFKEWLNEIISIELDKKNMILSSARNYNSKLLIESVHNYMIFLNNYFYKPFGEKIRAFIFLEYFLKKLENDTYIQNSDEYCHLIKLYYFLCRDAENIFDYLEKKEILTKNELFYYEKGCYYERIHKYLEANQTYIEGFINILDENNLQKGKILQNNYINFEDRMKGRIARDLESLNEDWSSIEQYIQKMIKETKENEIKNVNINLNSKKKYFLKEEETNEKFLERKLIKNINIDFSLAEGKLLIKNPAQISKGIEVIGVYGNVKYIKNPPDINKITSITCIYELLKKVLSTFFPQWKKEYDNFDLQVKSKNEKLPYSWINKQRPTQTNLKNMNDNNTVLNLIQKEYLNAQNDNKEENVNNNKDNNLNIKDENKVNDHEISNMLSNIGLILDKKDSNPINTNTNNNIENINNIINNSSSIIEKDNKTLIANMQYQMEHPYENKSKNRVKIINNENNKKIKKKAGIKTNKFKCVGKLNFDKDGLMIINLENDSDKKIEVMQSASKLFLNNDQEKKNNKKYTIVLSNAPRRIKYIKEKTVSEKKDFEIKKKEMLQGVNFDYLNSFKKLFETYPELNNLLDSNQKKTSGGIYNINLENKKSNNINNNLIEETNIQRQDGPSDAMKLLLEVYGIPQNFLEENNPFMEYAKKNGINSNFAFENLFKDMQSYINKKNLKKNNNINKNSKRNNQEKENIDADGDLIIESESEDNSLKEERNNLKENNSKKKASKHCIFDSKKNSQIVYLKSEQNENGDEVGKIIDNINKKAEKGVKIGEKTIFSNYKGIREHNNNNKNLIVNQSIQLSIKKEKDNMNKIQDELNKRKMIINNSKISTKVFMSAFNYDLSNKNNIEGINSKKRSKSKKNLDMMESSIKQQNLSNSLMIENNFKKNNFMTESNYSKNKRGKLYGSINDEFRTNNYKQEKENQLSNIKESVEKEKSSKIDKNENENDDKNEEIDDKKNKRNYKGNLGVIGNIRDLDNFDDLFK